MFLWVLYNRLLPRGKHRWMPILVYAPLTYVVHIINATGLPYSAQIAIFLVLDIVFTLCCFRGTIQERMLWGFFNVLVSSLANSVVLALFSLSVFITAAPLFQVFIGGNWSRILATALYLLTCAGFYLYVFRLNRDLGRMPARDMSLYIATFIVCIFQSTVAQQLSTDPALAEHFGRFLGLLLISSSCVVMLVVFTQLLSRMYSKNQVLELELQKNASERAHLADMQSNYYALNAWRHDYHNHLQIIKFYVDHQEWQELAEYLSELDQQFSMLHISVETSNNVFNALVSSKMVAAVQHGITMRADVKAPAHLPMDDATLCVLMGNLLDNALDAAGRLPPEQEPWVELNSALEGDRFTIVVRNNCDGVYRMRGDKLLSTKDSPNHGVGLARVRQIVEAVEGVVDILPQAAQFEVRIALPCGAEQTKRKVPPLMRRTNPPEMQLLQEEGVR